MSRQCTHLLTPGQQCQAPAVTGSSFCRHHDPRKRIEAAQQGESEPFVLPELEDSRSLLRAVNEVLHAMSERRIKRSEGGTLLFGLQLASKFMHEIETQGLSPLPPAGFEPGGELDPDESGPEADEAESASAESEEPVDSAAEQFYMPTPEETLELFHTLQTGNVEDVLDQWEAKRDAWAQGIRPAAPTNPTGTSPARRLEATSS